MDTGIDQLLTEASRNPRGVALAFLHPGNVVGTFCDSIIKTLMYDARHEGLILKQGGYMSLESSPRIAEARSILADALVDKPEFSKASWLWMVDADMTWDEDALYRLLEVADPVRAPIVGGLCFAGGRSDVLYPTLLRMQGDGTLDRILDYPRDSLVKVDATGAAFLLVHRSVFVRMAKPHPVGFGSFANGVPNPHPWFTEGTVDRMGIPYGEDIAFCLKARRLGIPIHVDTSIKVGHTKSYQLNEEVFDRMMVHA